MYLSIENVICVYTYTYISYLDAKVKLIKPPSRTVVARGWGVKDADKVVQMHKVEDLMYNMVTVVDTTILYEA